MGAVFDNILVCLPMTNLYGRWMSTTVPSSSLSSFQKWFCLFLGIRYSIITYYYDAVCAQLQAPVSRIRGFKHSACRYKRTHIHAHRHHTNNLLSYQHFTWNGFLFTFKIILVVTKRKISYIFFNLEFLIATFAKFLSLFSSRCFWLILVRFCHV